MLSGIYDLIKISRYWNYSTFFPSVTQLHTSKFHADYRIDQLTIMKTDTQSFPLHFAGIILYGSVTGQTNTPQITYNIDNSKQVY